MAPTRPLVSSRRLVCARLLGPLRTLRGSSQDAIVNRVLKILAAVYLVWLIAAVMAYKAAFVGADVLQRVLRRLLDVRRLYILSRFLFSLFYRSRPDAGIEPRIAIVMPGFNEQDAIAALAALAAGARLPAREARAGRRQRRLDRRTLVEMRERRHGVRAVA